VTEEEGRRCSGAHLEKLIIRTKVWALHTDPVFLLIKKFRSPLKLFMFVFEFNLFKKWKREKELIRSFLY